MAESKENYNFHLRVKRLQTVDNIIVDKWPLVDAFKQQYKKGLLVINYFVVDLVLYLSHYLYDFISVVMIVFKVIL